MRRQNRRPFSDEKETNKIIYLSISILVIAVLAFTITFIIYSNYLNKDTKIAEFKTTTIKELEELNKENSSQASSSIGKNVNEVEKETSNETKNEVTRIAINTTNMEKEDVATTAKPTEVKEEKKEEKVPDPVFTKPVEGEIVTEFASDKLVYSNTLQEWVTHNGIDIKADKTTVVKASEEGTVKSIKNDPRYGITVVIEHSNGYSSVYSNLLTAEFVKEKEKVKKGQTIGTVGNTATFEIADEAHLHFEILKNNEYVDPSQYIKYKYKIYKRNLIYLSFFFMHDNIRKNKIEGSLLIKMSNVTWTNEQKQAIYEKNKNLLVAAAARKWKNSSISRAYNS